MPRNQRFAMLGLALLTAVVAVLLIGSGGEDPQPSTPAADVESATPEPTPTTGDDTEEPPTPTPTPNPIPTLSADNPKRLKVKQGETVRFAVTSSEDEEVHLHGYDKSKDVKAGETVQMSVKADITGIFEIELENSAKPVGELEVRP